MQRYLTTREIATTLSISRKTAVRIVLSLPHIRLMEHGQLRVLESDFEQYKQSHAEQSATEKR